MGKVITTDVYILLYTNTPLNEIGNKYWQHYSIYDTEEAAIGGLLSIDKAMYEHARIIKTKLPTLTVPDDLETIIGEPVNDK